LHVLSNCLLTDRRHPSILPFPTRRSSDLTLNATVVRRGIRCPVEPCGDCEIEVCHGDRRSCDMFSASKESRPPTLPSDVRRAAQRPVTSIPRDVFHLSARG